MNRRNIILFISGLLLALLAAGYQRAPGYMDADYYFLGGVNLAGGNGFNEQILWNYLGDPAGVPHPSHGYWMPLTSVITAAGLRLGNATSFDQAQLVFVLLAAFVPPLTAVISDRLYVDAPHKRRQRAGWLAGLLALFPGYYFGFLTTTDSFSLYMLLGAIFILLLLSGKGKIFEKAFLLGAVAGLMHLTRADGFLWLFLAPSIGWHQNAKRSAGSAMGGYFIIMGGWLIRNQMVFGSLLAPGGSRAFWWTSYEDLFAFPAEILTAGRWLDSGILAIVDARFSAAGQNLLSALAVNGMVFLFPLMLAAIWRLRGRLAVRIGTVAWGLVYLLMTIVFPFAGARGGFFHAAAAVQPLLWALVPEGLTAFIELGQKRRDWRPSQATPVFTIGIVGIAFAATAFLGWARVISPGLKEPAVSSYRVADEFLTGQGIANNALVMVNNPPGYALESSRPAIVIPDGGLPAILAASGHFEASALLLGPEQGLDDLYRQPTEQAGLTYLGETAGLKIFLFDSSR